MKPPAPLQAMAEPTRPARPTEAADEPSGFFARWSRRKAQSARGEPAADAAPVAAPTLRSPAPVAAPAAVPAEVAGTEAAPERPPAPTLDDVARLDIGADVRRFVAPGVDRSVANAALKKLFADPHFNVMDGLDTYIDDYGLADPLPAGMLEQMAGSRFMGLFTDAPVPPPDAGPPAGTSVLAEPASSPDVPEPPVPDAAAPSADVAPDPSTAPLPQAPTPDPDLAP